MKTLPPWAKLSGQYTKPTRVTSKAMKAARMIMNMWKQHIDEAAKLYPNDGTKRSWHRHDVRQAYRDSLEAMRQANLINDYSLKDGIV